MAKTNYYKSAHWLKLRAKAIAMAGNRCTVLGCMTPTHRLTVDHIRTRPPGAPGPTEFDVIPNLRVLCHDHDVQIKERPDGSRFNLGKLSVRGYDANGLPLDPNHPWNR